MKLVPVLDWLSQLLRVGAFLIDIDINIVEQFTIFTKQPLPNRGKLFNQVVKALTNSDDVFYHLGCLDATDNRRWLYCKVVGE